MIENQNNIKAWRDAVSTGQDCLSPEDLHALLQKNGSEENRRHVTDCPHCQAELAMIASFESPESLGETVGDQRGDIAWIVSRLQAQPKTIAFPPQGRRAAWRSFLRLPYIAATAAAALVMSLGISLYIFEHPQKPVLTADVSRSQPLRSLAVQLTAPSGSLEKPPESFQWERFSGARSYSVELLEVDGSVLWTGRSEQEILPISSDLKAKMRPGKPLSWKVTALDSSGKAIAGSNAEHFMVKPVKPMNGK